MNSTDTTVKAQEVSIQLVSPARGEGQVYHEYNPSTTVSIQLVSPARGEVSFSK